MPHSWHLWVLGNTLLLSPNSGLGEATSLPSWTHRLALCSCATPGAGTWCHSQATCLDCHTDVSFLLVNLLDARSFRQCPKGIGVCLLDHLQATLSSLLPCAGPQLLTLPSKRWLRCSLYAAQSSCPKAVSAEGPAAWEEGNVIRHKE